MTESSPKWRRCNTPSRSGKRSRRSRFLKAERLHRQRLTDGIFGSWESWSAPDVNWVAYKGEHMDFVLDLGEVMDIQSINMDFLNAQAQPDWNLLVLPAYVTYATSADGKTFGDEVKVSNPNNPNPKENPDIAKIPVQSFRADLGTNVKARYIKVHGESILRMPSWHIRAGLSGLDLHRSNHG